MSRQTKECPEGHIWEVRSSRSSCLICSGKLIQGENDLRTLAPHLEVLWDSARNPLPMEAYAAGSRVKANWLCSLGHSWECSIVDMYGKHLGCPYCSNYRVLAGFNDLATTHPHLLEGWDYDKNSLLPSEVTKAYSKKVWWRCAKGHEWETSVKQRATLNRGCLICAGKVILPGFNDLASQRPNLASFWHPTKNLPLTPQGISPSSGKKVWWQCSEGHVFQSSVDAVSRRNKTGTLRCGVCTGKIIQPGVNDLASYAPATAAQWHPTKNAPLTAETVAPMTSIKIWWQCDKGHEWEATPKDRLQTEHNTTSCPICINRKVLPGVNDFTIKFPHLMDEWHPTLNEGTDSRTLSYGSQKQVWWKCSKDHEWKTSISERARNNTGCPVCSRGHISKKETELVSFLNQLGLDIQTNKRTVIPPQELDIYIPERNLAIEFNGLYWHTEALGKDKWYHHNKWKACQDKGIQLVQIWEDDWDRNPDLVKRMLAHKLGMRLGESQFARKTQVENLSKEVTDEFLEANHIQGTVNGSLRVGLKDDKGTLVAVMVLRAEGENSETLNLLRYATSNHIVGGFTKLLTYVERTNPKTQRILTFSDNAVSDGNLYRANGFKEDKVLRPDYAYYVRGRREHKFGYRLRRFRNDPALIWQEGLTEKELGSLNGLSRIWDAGKIRWVKELTRSIPY